MEPRVPEPKTPTKLKGTVKYANSKGFGFIGSDKDIDFFFHYSQFQGDWKVLLKRYVNDEKVEVLFDSDPLAPEGPRALRVLFLNENDHAKE